MLRKLALTALLVRDYDEAIAFYVGQLGFDLREDTALTSDKRWVVVAPPGSAGGLLLARAADERQEQAIGNQSGGRVFLFLEPPRHEPYGTVAVFEDLYGNRWDLIQPGS